LVLILGQTTQDRGKEFEDFTAHVLENLSFRIIDQRVKSSFREIDLLAEDFFKRKYIIECKEYRMSREYVTPMDVDNLAVRVIKHEEAKTGLIMTTGFISQGAYQNAILLRDKLRNLNIDFALTNGTELTKIYSKEATVSDSEARKIANNNGLIGRLEVELGYFYGKPCWVVLLKRGKLIENVIGIDARNGSLIQIKEHLSQKFGGRI